MYKNRFSEGYVSYFLDLTDKYFLKDFIKEVKAAFDNAKKISDTVTEDPFNVGKPPANGLNFP